MADGSTENDSYEQNLPNGRSIFNLITSNNLDAIRSILTPLTLCDRLLIVHRRVDNETLLYHACELGFKDIVKYLLDECGADINDGYCDSSVSVSPISVAIQNLDVFLMTLLMRRGATVGVKIRETACVDYTLTHGYFSLMSILRLYKYMLHRSTLLVSMSEGAYKGLFVFSWGSNFAYDIRSKDFLAATASGRVDRMKILLECGVNTNMKNYHGDNALCVAILSDQRDSEDFLINYRVYTLKSYALALELCGANLIVFRNGKDRGLECWRKSVIIRRANGIGFADKDETEIDTDLGIEFQTEEEIDRLHIQNCGNCYLQALIVFRRILPRFSQLTQNAFVSVARNRIFKDDLLQPLKILSELYNLPSRRHQGFRCPTLRAIGTISILLRSRFLCHLEDESDFLQGFGRLYDFFDAHTWGGLLRGGFEFYRIAYGELLEITLKFIYVRKIYNLSPNANHWFKMSIGNILQRYSYPYPTTLIHKAIEGEFPSSIISFLLKCSADANCPDALGNTPLHLVSSLPRENHYLFRLTHLLIRFGAHIDSMNTYGIRPIDNLKEKRIIRRPLKFLSLQCLAAQAIHRNRIFVSEETLPPVLVKFLRLHSPSF